jgi:hypothetical protein
MNRWMSSHQMPPKIRKKKPRKTEAQINLLELETRKPFALFLQQRTPIIECFAELRLCESELTWTLGQRKKRREASNIKANQRGKRRQDTDVLRSIEGSGIELASRYLWS